MTASHSYEYKNEQVHLTWQQETTGFELLFFGMPYLGNRLIGRTGKSEARVERLSVRHGSDLLGDYEELVLDFVSDKAAAPTYTGLIRLYEGFLLFETIHQHELPGKKNKHLFGHPYISFPSFEGSKWQDGLSMLSFKRQAPFNYPEQWFGKVTQAFRSGKHTPLLITNERYQTVIVSPLNHLLYGSVSISKYPPQVRCGLPRALKTIPEGTSHQTLVVYGQGVNRTMQRFGELLMQQYGTHPVDHTADASLRYISYWTNAGSAYWYKAHKKMSYEDTFRRLQAHHEEIGLKIGLYQLDSWWYKRDGNHYISSITEWEPKPVVESKNFNSMLPFLQRFRLIHLFKDNRLSAVQAILGKPIGTHFKQISNESTYTEQFEFVKEDFAVPRDYDNAYRLFRQLFDHPRWRLSLVIHDWLHLMALEHTAFSDIEMGPAYFKALDDALLDTPAADNETGHLTLQLCMQLPSITLLASSMKSVTSMRSTSDSNSFLIEGGRRWWWHLYSSFFIHAMGKTSFLDNRSTNKNYLRPFSPYSRLEFIWMALSCGPIGLGDKIGKENMELVRRVVNTEGEILKPETPCRPLDQAFLHNPGAFSATKGVTVYSSDQTGSYRSYYALTFNCHPLSRKVEMSFSLSELDDLSPGRYVMYDYCARTAKVTDDTERHPFMMSRRSFYFHIVSPLVHGKALIGDVSKHVSLSRQIVQNARIEANRIHLTLSYTAGSQCQLVVYAPTKPVEVRFNSEQLPERKSAWSYHSKTRLINVYVQDIPEGLHEVILVF